MKVSGIHSPSQFDPKRYRLVGCFYQGRSVEVHESDISDPEALKALSVNDGNAFAYEGHFKKHNACDHCGSRFAYGVVYQHDEGDIVVVGQYCARNAFGSETKAEANLKRIAGAVALAREETVLGRKIAALFLANPGLEEALCVRHRIISEMRSKICKWGDLSEKQIAFCIKLADEVTLRESTEPKILITEGRRQLVGTVLSVKTYHSVEWGTAYKMLLKTDEGEKMWGPVPGPLVAQRDTLKGTRVQFKGTVKGTDKDMYFGVWSRPSNAAVVGVTV